MRPFLRPRPRTWRGLGHLFACWLSVLERLSSDLEELRFQFRPLVTEVAALARVVFVSMPVVDLVDAIAHADPGTVEPVCLCVVVLILHGMFNLLRLSWPCGAMPAYEAYGSIGEGGQPCSENQQETSGQNAKRI